MNVQLDDAATQFAHDLGALHGAMATCAIALLRGEGFDELAEFARMRKNLGVLYQEIIKAPNYGALMDSIHATFTAKGLPVDWLY